MNPESDEFPNNIQVLGWFGRDKQGNYCENDAEVVEYFHRPAINYNLKWDLTLKHPKDQQREDGTTYEHIFEWIMRNNTPNNETLRTLDVDFVCKRSVLQEIMKTAENKPFGQLDKSLFSLTILAKRLQSVIYLCASWSDNGEYKRKSSGPNYQLGSKFEHYLLAKKGQAPDPKRPIQRYDDMQLVYCAQIDDYRVLYAGEVDGLPLDADLKDLNAAKLVELKTFKVNENDMEVEERYPGWWNQCVLSKCREVLLGKLYTKQRKTRTRVNHLESISLDRLGENVDAEKVTKRVKDALEFISGEMETAGNHEVRMFYFQPNGTLAINKQGIPPSADAAKIIPANYVASLNKLD